MFIFNNQPLSPDSAFVDPKTGIQYPANWLRLASPADRAAIGITEVPDPAPYDQRFYWSPELPKDHTQLVEQWVQQTRTTANTLLAPTDWQVIREADNGKVVPNNVKTLRENIRLACGNKVSIIQGTLDTDDLAAYITHGDYPVWPNDSPAPVEPAADDGVVSFSNGSTSAGFGL